MSERRTKLFQKQWDLVMALQRHARGISRKRLIEVTGLPSTTLHRCIGELRAYGVPIETRTRNGEAWHCVEHAALPALGITAPQLLALRFSRRMLAPLEGTQITREIDALLQPHALRDSPESAVSLRATAPSAPKIVDVIERAIQQRRRVRIRVFTRNKPEPHDRIVDPLCLRCADKALYLVGFDRSAKAFREFKVARISHAEKLIERCDAHPDFDEGEFWKHAGKVGTGDAVEVAIRFAPRVAKIGAEYPLVASQTLRDAADGGVVLSATVAGLHEVQRYVLGWGQDAEVLAPAELREAVAEELETTLRKYRGAAALKRRGVEKRGAAGRGTDRVLPRIAERG